MMALKSKFLSYCLICLIPSILQAVELNYTEATTSFPNPERGWYAYTLMLDNNNYQQLANTGFRLVYSSIVLNEFVNRDIDNETLDTIENRFSEMRNAGLKAVLRVNYSETHAGNYPNLGRIERHMQQLSPVLNDNKDVIAYIEAGYMGPWGEWHFWNINNPPFPDNESSWRQLTDLLLENKPSDRFIMLRYPSKKQQIFDGMTITSDNAFFKEDIARIGHHNDCFVSSNDDVGTYQPQQTEYSSSIEDLKNYLMLDTIYSPMGGETCSVHSRNSCSMTIAEMEDFHWTYMNNEYHPEVLSSWRREGCYEEIDKRLGYRLSLVRVEIPDTLVAGSNNNLTIELTNTGFARPWYFRTPYIRYIQGEEIVGQVPLTNIDIRVLAPQENNQIIVTTEVPGNLNGNFDIALWLPDENEANHSNHRFSIRLANENVWNNQHGHNVIARDIQISNSIVISPPSPPILLIE
jgi:hypothetical protein